MKVQTFFAILVANLAVASAAFGDSNPNSNTHGILADLRNLTLKCVVRPYMVNANGQKVLLPLQSVCQELVVTDKSKASIVFEGQNFYAELLESNDSDGGDLGHLVIRNNHGRVIAIRRNVLAFDDVLIALAGGKDEFAQVRQ